MITVSATISLLSGDNSKLALSTSNLQKNNISSSLEDVVGQKTNGKNPFVLGSSKLNTGTTLNNTIDYFIGNSLSDENGTFSTKYEINISDESSSITSLTISFDTLNNRHPKSLLIDGKQYIDDDAIFTISNLNAQSNHKIEISNWNTPNAPLVITGIYAEVTIDIDRKNLVRFERTIYDRSDLKMPSFGIISNTGNIEFIDYNGEVRDYAEQMLLTSGNEVELYINNSLTNQSQLIGVFETSVWDYDNENRIVNVSITDGLTKYQNVYLDDLNYDFESKPTINLDTIIEHINNNIETKLGLKYEIFTYGLEDYNITHNTYVKYAYLRNKTIWEALQNICEAFLCHIYKGNEDAVYIRHKGGN